MDMEIKKLVIAQRSTSVCSSHDSLILFLYLRNSQNLNLLVWSLWSAKTVDWLNDGVVLEVRQESKGRPSHFVLGFSSYLKVKVNQ